MCILLLSTLHSQYPLIILSNRDEFLARPTRRAYEWAKSSYGCSIFAGQDLLKSGTWLGITKEGKFAALTNVQEANSNEHLLSRGELVTSFLSSKGSTEEFLMDLTRECIGDGPDTNYGGFSLICGNLLELSEAGDTAHGELGVISNRDGIFRAAGEVHWVLGGKEAVGLSNSLFNEPWPKVTRGTALLEVAIQQAQSNSTMTKMEFIERLFDLLSSSTTDLVHEGSNERYSTRELLRRTIFVPATRISQPNKVKGPTKHRDSEDTTTSQNAWYGTQKQSVILMDKSGHVTFVERTVYDQQGQKLPKNEMDQIFEFDLVRL